MAKQTKTRVTQVLLDAVIESYMVGDVQFYRDLGLTDEQVNWLSNRTSAELSEFCKSTIIINTVFKFRLDPTVFDLRRIDYVRQQNEKMKQESLLLFGAPVSMMTYLFGLTNEDCAKLRRKLQISRTGRPIALTESQLLTVDKLWWSSKSKPLIDRLIEIGKANICLSSVWPMIYELIEKESTPAVAQELTR